MSKNQFITRGNSICPSPPEILLKAVQDNDIQELEDVLNKDKGLINCVYEEYESKTILMVACDDFHETVEPKTVKCLLENGADINFTKDSWKPLHFAIYYNRLDIVEIFLEHEPKMIDTIVNSDNLLHFVIKEFVELYEEKEALVYIKLLLDNGINVNHLNNNNKTPIFFAARKKYKQIVKLILESRDKVLLDAEDGRESARSLIKKHNLYNLDDVNENVERNYEIPLKDEAFKWINGGQLDELKTIDNLKEIVNENNGSETLLQRSCSNNQIEIVQYLLNNGANPYLTIATNPKTAIQLVLEQQFYEIFDLLKSRYFYDKKTIPDEVVEMLAKKDCEGHQKRFEELLNKQKDSKDYTVFNINYINADGNNLLHFANRYSTKTNALKLLNLGCSLAVMNRFHFMPVHDVNPETLEEHLNDCICIENKGTNEDLDLTVSISFKTILVPTNEQNHNQDLKEEKISIEEQSESIPLRNTSQSSENPRYCNSLPETDVVLFLSKSIKHKHLLKHPVIVTYLLLKWHQIRWLFRLNLAFYVIYLLSLILYILYSYANFYHETNKTEQIIGQFSHILLCVAFTLLALRELFQFTIATKRYLTNFENYLELGTIFLTFLILTVSDPSNEFRKQISSVTILLAAFVLILLVGQHPKLSTNVEILKQVLLNFFHLLLWYSILIIAFVLSFYLMFADTQENPEENSFRDPGQSFFKTIIMITGEFDASSIHFNTVLSKIIFCLFIFMISIILLNLLNGLAVSDIQAIKNDCELVGHVARTKFISYAEEMIRGKIIPKRMLKNYFSVFCCFSNNDEFNSLSYTSVCSINKDGKVHVKIYKQGLIVPVSSSKQECHVCSLHLDEESVKRIEDIIDEKNITQKHCKGCCCKDL